MAKRYLNNDERFRVITISALTGQIKETIELWENLKRSPLVLKYLRTCNTFGKKAIEEIYKEISEEEKDRLWNYANRTKFGIMIGNTRDKSKETLKYSTSDKELVDDIAEALIEQHCKHCNNNKSDCRIRKCFESWEIEPFKTILDDEEECQYRYE